VRKHAGFSLVEALVAMTLATTAMTIAVVTLTAVQRADRDLRDQTMCDAELHRFALQLRADAHQALSAKITNDSDNVLRLVLSGSETIQYTLQAGHVQRDQRRDDKVIHHETYRLPESTASQWRLNENGTTPVVGLSLEPQTIEQSGHVAEHPETINAAVGLLNQPVAQVKS